MHIKEQSRIKPLFNIIAFKWIKPSTITKSGILVPDSIFESHGERLGHTFTCEVLSCGPKCNELKPGDRFILHEYNRIDQGQQWKEEDIMFCHEKHIALQVPKDYTEVHLARIITDDSINDYLNETDTPEICSSENSGDTRGPEWARQIHK